MSKVMRIKQLHDLAGETDIHIPTILVFLPPILGLVGIIMFTAYIAADISVPAGYSGHELIGAGAAGMLALSIILIVVGTLVDLYLVYKWIDRLNKHTKRVNMLYQELADYLESKGLEERSSSIKNILRQMELDYPERSPGLWAILVFIINILIFYVLHFLTRDIYVHSRRELFIWEEIGKAFETLGHPILYKPFYEIPDRNTILYFVLTVLTIGLFGIYWRFVVNEDPNKHFKEHIRLEKELIDKLEKIEESSF